MEQPNFPKPSMEFPWRAVSKRLVLNSSLEIRCTNSYISKISKDSKPMISCKINTDLWSPPVDTNNYSRIYLCIITAIFTYLRHLIIMPLFVVD